MSIVVGGEGGSLVDWEISGDGRRCRGRGGVGGLGDEAGYGKGVMGGEGLEGCGLRFGMVVGWEVG